MTLRQYLRTAWWLLKYRFGKRADRYATPTCMRMAEGYSCIDRNCLGMKEH